MPEPTETTTRLQPWLILNKVEMPVGALYTVQHWRDPGKRGSGTIFSHKGWTIRSSTSPTIATGDHYLYIWGTSTGADKNPFVVIEKEHQKAIEELVSAYNAFMLVSTGELKLPVECPEGIAIQLKPVVIV